MALWIGALLFIVFALAVPSTLRAARVSASVVRVGEVATETLGAAQNPPGTPTTIVGTVGQTSPATGILAGSPGGTVEEMRLGIWYQAQFGAEPVGIADGGPGARSGLGPNHPNPFRGSTRLRMAIPDRDRVRLQVFDVSGREVGTLVDEELDGGQYEIHMQAGSLSPGLYFVRLHTSQGTVSRKILHLD